MKKDTRNFKEWAERQVRHYLPILGLPLQEVTMEYRNEVKFLEITCTYPYLDTIVRFNDKAVEEWKSGYLKKDRILHELCHMITDPLYFKAIKRYVTDTEINEERERLTDTIAMIVRNLT